MSPSLPWLSIVVPVLNEGERLALHLRALAPWRAAGCELLVVDGGSQDGSLHLAEGLADCVLTAPRGRGAQMNAGAAVARSPWLLFLHADTQLPPEALAALQEVAAGSAQWGRFDVQIDSPKPMLAVVSQLMNWRSRATGMATGDQAMFVRRAVFEQLGGFADLALMEDIELSRRLRRLAWPRCLPVRVRTSARRWEQHGVWRTIWLMWRLRAAYFLGADPDRLALRYGYRPRQR